MLLSFALYAQEPVEVERSTNKVILEGKVYYIHMVEPGQTLYSISRAYNVSQKEIAIENPGVMSGIRVGQALKIPVEPMVEQEIDTSDYQHAPDGKRTHKVKPGETLYSIAREYGTTEKALKEANPSVRPRELKPGQRLNLPQPSEEEPDQVQEPAYNEEGFAYHKVKRRETLYSIARFYEVSVQDIRSANPELGWGGPKTGQVIRIPLPQLTEQTEPFEQVSPDSILEAYDYKELMATHDNRRRTYRIAYFIPFDFQESEPLDSLIKDVESASRRNWIIERYRMEQKIPQSVQFMEFFHGSLLALDSMRRSGMKLDVKFFDTKKSMSQTRSLLEQPGMDDMDLIIGPFWPYNLELVSGFAAKEKIPLVNPFYNEKSYVWDNPWVFQLTPSVEEEYRELAKLVASKHQYNIVFVREEDSLDTEKHAVLKEMIFDGFDDYQPKDPIIFKEMVLTLNHTDKIIQSLSTDRKNLIVVPTRNEALASSIVSSLYYQLRDFDIELIGSPYWTEFSSIDFRYYHELSMVFYSSFWMDYLDPGVDAFLSMYRDHFVAEPLAMTRKGINYGIAGYDVTLYFASAMKVYGRRFILSLEDYHPTQVLDPYSFERVTPAGGYENRRISFYQFLPDMTIRSYSVPDLPVRHYFFRPMDDGKRKSLNWDMED